MINKIPVKIKVLMIHLIHKSHSSNSTKGLILPVYPLKDNKKKIYHLWSNFNLKKTTTICDSLGMVASTGCGNPSFSLLLGESSKCGGCTSDFETSDWLEVLSFEKDVGFVLFGEKSRLLQLSMGYYRLIFAIGLIYLRCGH